MTLLFIGKGREKEIRDKALGLLARYHVSHPGVYADVRHEFEKLKVANSPEDPHSQPFRWDMWQAVESLLSVSDV